MNEKEPTPYELRMWQFGVINMIEKGAKPSDLIRMLNSNENPDYVRVGWEMYETVATPEFKLRVEKVKEALKILSEFDRPVDPQVILVR